MKVNAKSKRLLAGLLIIVAIAAAGFWYWSRPDQVTYSTAPVGRSDVQDTVSALGVLVPSEYVDVGSRAEGQLIDLKASLGETVTKGQLLAVVDPTPYAAAVQQSQAEIADQAAALKGAEAQLELARWSYGSNSRLAAQGAATRAALEQSEEELRAAQSAIASIRAKISAAQAVLKINQANLGYTRIYAPMAGLITSPTSAAYGMTWSKLDIAREGQILNTKQTTPTLFRIAKLDRMIVRAQVSEADVARLKPGMLAYVSTLGRPDQRIEAQLQSIEATPELVNGAIFYDAILDVANTDHALRPQMTAQVLFVVAEAKQAVTVPLTALASTQRQNGLNVPGCRAEAAPAPNADCVRVLVDGEPSPRKVIVGVKNEVSATIRSGLTAGEQVIVGATGPAPKSGSGKGGGKGGGRNAGGAK